MHPVARKKIYLPVLAFLLATVLFSLPRPVKAGRYIRTENHKQVYGLPQKEIPALMQKCLQTTGNWNYRRVISEPCGEALEGATCESPG